MAHRETIWWLTNICVFIPNFCIVQIYPLLKMLFEMWVVMTFIFHSVGKIARTWIIFICHITWCYVRFAISETHLWTWEWETTNFILWFILVPVFQGSVIYVLAGGVKLVSNICVLYDIIVTTCISGPMSTCFSQYSPPVPLGHLLYRVSWYRNPIYHQNSGVQIEIWQFCVKHHLIRPIIGYD